MIAHVFDRKPRFGWVGSAIKGSRFVRDYCANCGEPIRVARILTVNGVRTRNLCCDCDPTVRLKRQCRCACGDAAVCAADRQYHGRIAEGGVYAED